MSFCCSNYFLWRRCATWIIRNWKYKHDIYLSDRLPFTVDPSIPPIRNTDFAVSTRYACPQTRSHYKDQRIVEITHELKNNSKIMRERGIHFDNEK